MTTTQGQTWFTSVMGTGIVATAAVALPVQVPGLRAAAAVVWLAAAGLLTVLVVTWAQRPRTDRRDPAAMQLWGAPPMALLTVGGGALLLGRDWIGLDAAVAVDVVLWSAGTVLGLVSAVAVPYTMMTGHSGGVVSGAWLVPVVPPMVAAANGALLVPHVPAVLQRDLILACYAMFGVSLVAALLVMAQLWGRLAGHGVGAPATVPTLWIVLGPLGQSATAAHLLGAAAQGVLPAPYATGTQVFALLYGLPVFGFALLWLALAAAVTVRTARTGLPFTPAWWSFTFPVGTLVTGAGGLAARTGSPAFAALSVLLYLVLLVAWATVAARTLVAVTHLPGPRLRADAGGRGEDEHGLPDLSAVRGGVRPRADHR